MTTQQQRRAKARARHEAYVERQHAKAVRRRRRNVALAAVAGVLIVVGGGWFLWSVTDDGDATATDSPTDSETADDFTYEAAAKTLPKGAPADLILDTDHGPITITLNTTKAPKNSNSLAFLASRGYFDDTSCHRLTTAGIFVLQCGDRTGTGSGNPGYTTPDENLPDEGKNNYPKGTVAMAEPGGGEAGSQFFLVYDDTTLPPDYTIVGEVSKGLDVVQQIADAGVAADSPQPGDGPPAEPITITAARIEQSTS
ncbi:MAG TPA: peptidylprolyl isomerase [Actinomycetes bacterium]|nr:peptidylprolyl isomerase [Actinomycetes bacterium]